MDVEFANVYRFKKIVSNKYWQNGLFEKKLLYKKTFTWKKRNLLSRHIPNAQQKHIE